MIYIALFILFLILYLIFQSCQTKKKCKNKDDNGMIIKTIDLNYDFMDSFINKELTIIRNSTMNTKFIDDEKIVQFLKKEIKKTLGPEFFIAERGLWLRYYNSDKYSNPYETWHYDRKRYTYHSTQYRLVINLYDNSTSEFCYTLKCADNEEKCIATQKNTLLAIEANESYHKVKVENGERLVLMADVVNDSTRGICGTFFSIWDYIWLKIIINNFVGTVQ